MLLIVLLNVLHGVSELRSGAKAPEPKAFKVSASKEEESTLSEENTVLNVISIYEKPHIL